MARSDGLRARVGDIVHDLERPIAVADRALVVARFLRAHPVLTGGAVAAAVALRRHGPAGLAARALLAWRTWQTFAKWSGRLGLPYSRWRRRGSAGDATL